MMPPPSLVDARSRCVRVLRVVKGGPYRAHQGRPQRAPADDSAIWRGWVVLVVAACVLLLASALAPSREHEGDGVRLGATHRTTATAHGHR
jgi:hypothetical protein